MSVNHIIVHGYTHLLFLLHVNGESGLSPLFRHFVLGHLTEAFLESIELDLEFSVSAVSLLGSPFFSFIEVHLTILLLYIPTTNIVEPGDDLEFVNSRYNFEFFCISPDLSLDEGVPFLVGQKLRQFEGNTHI